MTNLPEKAAQCLTELLGGSSVHHLSPPLQIRPLVLYEGLGDLLARRREIWSDSSFRAKEYGYAVKFSSRIRPSHSNPAGRAVSGAFDILAVDEQSCLLASRLPSEEDALGPELLAERVHPIAARPIVSAEQIRDNVQALAERRDWEATTTDVLGYDETGSYRRDTKKQGLEKALLEMREQGRRPYSLGVSFRNTERKVVLRAYFKINGAVALHKGSEVLGPVVYYVIPAVRRFLQEGKAYSAVETCASPFAQQAVELTFRFQSFEDIERMKEICLNLAEERGLSVSIVHANPYVQAQVVDLLYGAVVSLLIMDPKTVTLVPRSGDCSRTLGRIATSLFRFAGEGTIRVAGGTGDKAEAD